MGGDKKYKVLIVHNEYKIAGGEDTVVKNEKQMLESHGHDVVLYKRSNKELDSMSKIQKLELLFTTIFNPQTYTEIKKLIKEKNIDIVHVHNTLNLVSPSVYYAAKQCKVPVVQTVHNFRLECMGACFYRDGKICEDCLTKGNMCAVKHSCYRGSKAQTIACLLSNWFHRKTGIYKKLNYICLTEFNKEKLLLWKHKGKPVLEEKQVFIKPNFTLEVDTSKIEKTNEDYYLFFGRIEEIKGIHIVIKAFEKMPDKKLKIAGNGTEFEKWQQYLNDDSVTNIEMLGFQNHEEINRLIYNAKAVVVASQWYETFGMIVAESFACGTPVIVGDIGNVGNLVQNGISGLKFDYNNIDGLVRVVEQFETLDRDILSKNALEQFKKYYAEEYNYNILSNIYELSCKKI